jgi:hypothetical protein
LSDEVHLLTQLSVLLSDLILLITQETRRYQKRPEETRREAMASEEVLDAVEDILRQEGVLDEIKKSLFLSVSRVVKKQKPIETVSKVKDFASTLDGIVVVCEVMVYDIFELTSSLCYSCWRVLQGNIRCCSWLSCWNSWT